MVLKVFTVVLIFFDQPGFYGEKSIVFEKSHSPIVEVSPPTRMVSERLHLSSNRLQENTLFEDDDGNDDDDDDDFGQATVKVGDLWYCFITPERFVGSLEGEPCCANQGQGCHFWSRTRTGSLLYLQRSDPKV